MHQRSALPLIFLPVTALVANAFIWGVSWWPFRALQGLGLHPLWSTALVYALVFALLLTRFARMLPHFARHPGLWALAIASGVTNVGFNWAVTVGDVVRVVLLFYLMPAWSVLVAWLLLGEKPTAGSLLRLVLAMAGVLVVLKTPESPWPIPSSLPDWLALAGGLSFALTNAYLRKLGTQSDVPSGARMLAMFGGGALLASGAAMVGMGQGVVTAPALALSGVGVVLVLGLSLAFLVSNACLQYGASRLPGSTTALVMLTEILFASVSAALLDSAEFTPRILWGGSLIVLAATLAALAPAPVPAH
ncbi:MAG: DMT family transporter [Polaromonas sp.]